MSPNNPLLLDKLRLEVRNLGYKSVVFDMALLLTHTHSQRLIRIEDQIPSLQAVT